MVVNSVNDMKGLILSKILILYVSCFPSEELTQFQVFKIKGETPIAETK